MSKKLSTAALEELAYLKKEAASSKHRDQRLGMRGRHQDYDPAIERCKKRRKDGVTIRHNTIHGYGDKVV